MCVCVCVCMCVCIQASLPTVTDEERQRLLTFVVVGGGPTGVQLKQESLNPKPYTLHRRPSNHNPKP